MNNENLRLAYTGIRKLCGKVDSYALLGLVKRERMKTINRFRPRKHRNNKKRFRMLKRTGKELNRKSCLQKTQTLFMLIVNLKFTDL